ncbi:carcinoembryonic antigen-related cell adhesion molecule 5 isoform X2 [Scleropages formosus]|uniref:carcinoembryonic antigen-related cell adhesion molecule 5 isoform X2 n=1 Tax=Scleropages formosus TaxID=113540 RepID=UPI0008790E25|nr:carcinoembryonic antigen-related cell adhesion molecule 5-like isoform X2 [Scleropages formosus]XP_018594964.1 carcinoembryonic antigen-related cell adhesion molecule 5-like isoform X2 [Scleropages formosus]
MDVGNLRIHFAIFLSVLECCVGQQALPPGPVSGMLAGNVTFPTNSPQSPAQQFLTITWTFKSSIGPVPVVSSLPTLNNIPAAYEGRVTVNRTTGSLELRQLTLSDSGVYAVNMVTEKGVTLTGETNLDVYAPVSEVTATANTTSPVEFNDTVSVTCSARGSKLFFKWLNGTSEIVSGGRVSLSNGNRTLTISSILRYDSGPLYCNASNVFMTRRSVNVTFDVYFGPDNAVMTTVPQNNLYTTGSNLTLSCSALSNPPAELHWAFNGNLLVQVGSQLKLDSTLESQSGNYSCWAYNSKTQRYKPSGSSQITILQKISGANLTGPSGPMIAGNSSANLTCQAKAGHIDSREWLKNGKTLSPSDTVTISADKSSVSIKPVQVSDSGEYLCKLTNRVSNDNAVYKLIVSYGPGNVKVDGKRAVEVGTRVELKCSAESVPSATFSWAFNDTARNVITPEYIIDHATYKDTGRYTCVASNHVTGLNASFVHTLSVKEEGSLPGELSSGAIAGIVIGVLVAIVIIAVVVKKVMKKRKIESPY